MAENYNNRINKKFTPVKGNEVLILSNGVIKTISLSDSHINAVACESINEFNGKLIECKMTFKDI